MYAAAVMTSQLLEQLAAACVGIGEQLLVVVTKLSHLSLADPPAHARNSSLTSHGLALTSVVAGAVVIAAGGTASSRWHCLVAKAAVVTCWVAPEARLASHCGYAQ